MQHVNSLVRLIREQAPLATRAVALCRLCTARPGVSRSLYLGWKAVSQTYEALGGGHLPPGLGDPLQASDLALRTELQGQARLSLSALTELPCWLAGRLKRAGMQRGLAVSLQLDAGQDGLLLIESAEEATGWLDWIAELLGGLVNLAGGALPVAPLLGADPLPAMLLDDQARVLEGNEALHALLVRGAFADARDVLPANHAQLLRGCLSQRRALHEVPSEAAGRHYLWTFIPDSSQQQVLVRGREATAQWQAEREAAKARRLYRLITENTTDLISRHTLDGDFLDASPASWRLLGYWPEELRDRPLHALMHPQDREQFAGRTRDALIQDGYLTETYRLRHRDGHYLWFETASRAIRETYTGAVVEVVSVSRDITARVRAEENRRRLAEVVEANTDLVLFVDPAGRLSYLNPAARGALHLAEEEALPELTDLLDPELQRGLQREGWAKARDHGAWYAEGRLRPCHSAPSLPVSLVLLAHRAAGGEPYYSLVARDMTERELRETQQRRHQDELAHTARLVTLGELASGIAHEINQPLAAVVNYAGASQRYLQMLGSHPDAAQRVAQGLARITEHANHASEVIRRLRAFLRKGQRRMQALDLSELARESLHLCGWEAGQAKVAIDQALADNLPPVYADRVLLEQVLLNLLRNAIDANRERHAGEPSRIVIGSAAEPGGQVRVWVEDNGAGVAGDALEHIFTPFYTSKPDGLGLGLSMSRSIVEGFGGSLEARHAEGGGLCLECRLPIVEKGKHDD